MTRTTLKRATTSLALLTLWIIPATQLVPSLVIAAYEQRSLPLLNALIVNRVDHPVEEYLEYWRNVTCLGAIWCVAIWALPSLVRYLSSPGFFDRAVRPATPGALGLIRSWVCGIALVMTLWEDLASTTLLPRAMARPKGVLHVLHGVSGFDRFLESAWALATFEQVTAFLLFLGVIGLATRVVVPAGAVCYLIMAGILREYAWFYHTGLLPIYVLAVLTFTPCGDGWSVDRLIRIARNRPVPPPDVATPAYGWSRYAVWTVVGVPYVAAGLSKLYYGGGLAWVGAENMKWILLRTGLAMMEFDFGLSQRLVTQPDVLFVALACVGLFTELLFGLALVSQWGRVAMPALMISVHLGILFLQNILFIDLILLLAVFYDFTPVRLSVGHWLISRQKRLTVWYDGSCGLCDRTVRMLSGLDLLGRVDVRDFRREDLDAFRRAEGVALEPSRLEDEMAVVIERRAYWGFRGYRVLAGALPLLWVVRPLLYLPGAVAIGDAIYRVFAQRRHGLCTLESAHVDGKAPTAVNRAGALGSVAIACFLLSWWVTHIEFYPLTTMKMFSNPNPRPGVVAYIRAVAYHQDGQSTRAHFDRWIGAMADSRYRMVIGHAFGTREERALCDEFLAASMRAANRQLPNGRKISGFEVQRWEWNFGADPTNPSHGRIVDAYQYRAPSVVEVQGSSVLAWRGPSRSCAASSTCATSTPTRQSGM